MEQIPQEKIRREKNMPVEDKKKEILDKAYKMGQEYERRYKGCSQCTVAAVQDLFDIRDDAVFKAASGFAGGVGITLVGPCGGLSGGVMVLSQLCGRERSNFDDPSRTRGRSFDTAKRLIDAFTAEFGSINCRDIQTRQFGRSYYLRDEDEYKKFEEAGAHSHKCPDVVGRAARMVAEIILDEDLIAANEKDA